MRRFTKQSLDRNHSKIVSELRHYGVEVIEIMLPVDTVCFYRGQMGFVEIKPEEKDSTYRRLQLEFMANTRCPVTVARTASEALEFLKTGKGLSDRQKSAITAFLMRKPKSMVKFSATQVDKVINEHL